MSGKRFYYASAFNLPDEPKGGARLAREIIPFLEVDTGDRCTSRWPTSEAHEDQRFRLTISATDLIDIARSDYVVMFIPTPTARGCHVEMGVAIALDRPIYLLRVGEGIGFDVLCNHWPAAWWDILANVLRKNGYAHLGVT